MSDSKFTEEKKQVTDAIAQRIGEVCKMIEASRVTAGQAGLSVGYEIKYDSEETFVSFSAWVKNK